MNPTIPYADAQISEPGAPGLLPITGPRQQERFFVVIPKLKEDPDLGCWLMAHTQVFIILNGFATPELGTKNYVGVGLLHR
jgi:hypothetical protein